MQTEEWRSIPGYEGSYEVSSLGRVRALDRVLHSESAARGYPRRVRGVELAPQRHSAGYLQVGLAGKSFLLHEVVATAFLGPRPAGLEVRHLSGDKDNCALDNLRWGTHVENCADRKAHGFCVEGEANPNAVLTAADVAAIRSATGLQKDIGRAYGICKQHVSRIKQRERWQHV